MGVTGKVVVQPSGSLDAPILVIAESPASYEERTGVPLTGPSGWLLDEVLTSVGLSPSEILKTNVHWTALGTWPTQGLQSAQALKVWAPQLDDLIRASKAKVVVTMGGPALQRMTGLTNVTDWRGSTLRYVDDPFDGEEMTWHPKVPSHPRVWPLDAMLVPTLHPSGILRDPRRSNLFLFKRDWEKVAKIVRGSWSPLEYEFHITPDPHQMWQAFQGAKEVYFDTEFNPEAVKGGWPYLIGLTCNGRDVWNCPLTGEYRDVVREILQRKDTLKGAHNIIADFRALRNMGIAVEGEWWCSLIGMYVCHPGTEVGLSPTSRYYLDDVQHRKWMDKSDERYNCFDVLYGWHSRQGQLREIASHPVDRMGEATVRMRLLRRVTGVMEDRGLFVDVATQASLKKEKLDEAALLRVDVEAEVAPKWEAHLVTRRTAIEGAKLGVKEIGERLAALCPVHKRGWSRLPIPKSLLKPGCRCLEVHEHGEARPLLEALAVAKATRHKTSAGIKAQEAGFNPKSRDHLAWFLYSPEALRLPLQRDHKTKSPTTGKHAIEKLSKLKVVQRRPEAWKVVQAIKRIQECEADVSRFIDIPVDDRGFTYPPFKIHGTISGRPAGGEDDKGDEDKAGVGETNNFNVPIEYRHMYVAPQGWVYVHADVRNQEGRLAAYFSQDANYLKHFEMEDAGGPDVHSMGAAIFFGIDPADARKVEVPLAGQMVDARTGAKVGRHAVSYASLPWNMLMHQTGCDLKEAIRMHDRFAEAYPTLTARKPQFVREVCGRYEVVPGVKPYAKQVERGRGWLSNPWGWTCTFEGRGEVRKHPVTGELVALPVQADEALALPQQSGGSSMWARFTTAIGEANDWEGWMPVSWGVYDSLDLLVPDTPMDVQKAAQVLEREMARPWEELGGMRLPIEVLWGYDLGEYNLTNLRKRINTRGLRPL